MEFSIEQKDVLDTLASLGCNLVFVQYDERFQSYAYFHLASIYPNLLESPIQIEVQEAIDEDDCASELSFEITIRFREYDNIDLAKLDHSIELIKDNKYLFTTLLYFNQGGENANISTTR